MTRSLQLPLVLSVSSIILLAGFAACTPEDNNSFPIAPGATGGAVAVGGAGAVGYGGYAAAFGGAVAKGGAVGLGGATAVIGGTAKGGAVAGVGGAVVVGQGGAVVVGQGGAVVVGQGGAVVVAQGGAVTTTTTIPPATAANCVTDLMTLLGGTDSNWIPNSATSCGMQGSIYAFGDGKSITKPAVTAGTTYGTACANGKCCISGATIVDATYAAYGGGLGFDLLNGGGTAGAKSLYKGPAIGFTVKISGTIAAGQPIRIQMPTGGDSTSTAPFKEITAVGTVKVLFSEATCPAWATAAKPCATTAAGIYSFQVMLPGDGTAATKVGAFTDVCIESLIPITS